MKNSYRKLVLTFCLLSPWQGIVGAYAFDATSSKKRSSLPTRRRSIHLRVDQQTSIGAAKVKSFSEGNGSIAQVRLTKDGSHFVVVGRNIGSTTLLLLLHDGSEIQYDIIVHGDSDAQVEVPKRQNIRLDFYYVELTKRSQRDLGIDWPQSVSGGSLNANFNLLSGAFQNAGVAIANQVLPSVDIGEAQGWAKVRRHATMVTSNGHAVEFSSGGAVNVAVSGALNGDIRSIDFGSSIRVLPRYDKRNRRIEVALKASVSALTENGGSPIPGKNESQIDTLVTMNLGQSLVLAGLDAAATRRGTRGLPGLARIPILGHLFASHRSAFEESRNVIIIVPSALSAVSAGDRSDIRDSLRMYDRFHGDLPRKKGGAWLSTKQ